MGPVGIGDGGPSRRPPGTQRWRRKGRQGRRRRRRRSRRRKEGTTGLVAGSARTTRYKTFHAEKVAVRRRTCRQLGRRSSKE